MSRILLAWAVMTASCGAMILSIGCSPGTDEPDDSRIENGPPPTRTERTLRPTGMAPISRPPVRKALVIPGCLLVPAATQEVPSQRDGLILVIGRELEPGEPLPPEGRRVTEHVPFVGIEVQPSERLPENQLITEKVDGKSKCYRPVKEGDLLKSERLRVGKVVKHYYRWREGDHVKKGQLLALVDPSLVTEDFAIRCTRLVSMEAEWQTGLAMHAEAEQRLRTAKQLFSRGAFSLEELRTAQLTLDRYRFEEVSKRQAVGLAQRELSQARTVLAMYEIRSKIDGVILAIARKPGAAVKSLEPVFRLQDSRRLYVEGQAECQHWPLLQRMKTQGRRVVVEPTRPITPQQQFSGHLLKVTGVAVTKDVNRPLIVSGSEDGAVRIWDKLTGRERAVLRHPDPVRAVACTPPGAEDNLCLAGTADGFAWLWSLDGTTPGEPRALRERHRVPVNSVSFSSDGKRCVTGGEDGAICLWETATGRLCCRVTNAHRGRFTSVQVTSDARLVSAGADNCLLVWVIGSVGLRHRLHRSQADRAGHARNPVRRTLQPGHPADRTTTSVPQA